MAHVNDELRRSIEELSEEQAMKAMDFVRQLRGSPQFNGVFELLCADPAIRVPTETRGFSLVRAIRGTGEPASRLLIEDRR
jgi:hypothetical protein